MDGENSTNKGIIEPGKDGVLRILRDGSCLIQPKQGRSRCEVYLNAGFLVNDEIRVQLVAGPNVAMSTCFAHLVSLKNFPKELESLDITEPVLNTLDGLPLIHKDFVLAAPVEDLSPLPPMAAGGGPYRSVTVACNVTSYDWAMRLHADELVVLVDPGVSCVPLIKARHVRELKILVDKSNQEGYFVQAGGPKIVEAHHRLFKTSPSRALMDFQKAMVKAGLEDHARI